MAGEMEIGLTYFLQVIGFSRVGSLGGETVVVHHRARVLDAPPAALVRDFIPVKRTKEGVEVPNLYKDRIMQAAYPRAAEDPFFPIEFV
ncbi:hypothetical protein A2V80_00880 [Candidatus Woesebacteria bacterium RBG_16_39_8b]|uniref:Uncharacterized protein n=1 Tax=Candidatus Woesebacteria bacterium RBG_16_39_8b TaxID=1802482 RepID=A0A1F7XE26_9BACT|nr:MAG: hypothetical protein A2V80_00880 [Candidatus Woesebacteria bacterium RBG_16_39_8b]